ncbi:MAG TPA: efflux RND transporter periplasmic adaptor subunit [Gemmatimonas sp.]|uniref:efflux RND transporter periplasmic adaptor subunit n=1 Tax=Gemmatimonas sp. TaxID=1962908 RepID=UPI002ED8EB71
MNRLMQITAATVGVAALAGAGMWTMSKRGTEETTYRFAAVEQGSLRSTVSASGTLSAVQTVEVGTQVSGQVSELLVDFNTRVKKGQLIARIDPILLKQAVQDAEAGVARAQASLAQAKEEFERTKTLHDEKIVTETEFNTARTTLALAQTSVTSAQIALERARQNLAYTNIYAPIDGVVIERAINLGQTVAASLSAPKLFVIANDLSHMQILASVDETDIGAIKEGQQARFTVQSFQDRQFRGKVEQVRLASTTANNVVSYTVVIDVANPDGALLPGMTATVQFVTGEATDVLMVANTALRFRPPVDPADSAARRATATAGGSAAATPQGAPGAGPNVAGGTPRAGGQGAGGFGGGAPGEGRRAGGPRSDMSTIYTLEGTKLVPHRVHIGITDGTRTEIRGDGITAGMQVVIGSNAGGATNATSGTTASPFQQQQQQRGRGGPPGPF